VIGAMQDVTKEKEHERQTAMAIIEAQEKERKELGMELHDNVNQLLGATLLYLGMAKKSGKADKEILETLNSCVDYVNEAITDIRNLSHRLTPSIKDNISLKAVIKSLIEPLQKTKQFEIDLQVDDFEDVVLESDVQTNVYRIIQEQLNNILKHAGASKVFINILLTKENIKLSIRDNGKGFDTTAAKEGIGLQNMRQRVELFSGIFTISSSPGNGCELKVEIPLP
jgi:signal transduction histidine kinase